MLRLTRLNHHPIAINPDHISWIEALPDTTLFLISSEKLIVRESVDEVIEQTIVYRRLIRQGELDRETAHGAIEGDPPRFGGVNPRHSTSGPPARPSSASFQAATSRTGDR